MDELINKLIRKYKTNNPFELAKCLKINVMFHDLGDNTRGFYTKKLRRRYIVIHNQLDENWQRFVCAHELAHDRLHPGISRFWIDESSFFVAGKFERQANRFAIRLLTAGDSPQQGESLQSFFNRHNLPESMEAFY
ncbi:ImmA/IrrE family metallo-endopeptidase [Paenibacillus whitsoniae]|uniref:ImmA/IrrE family metallo-endopeptidase n=1 Tax=Paenibacillus whitsoniae TaxID=2496558 RepID=A0A430JE44_9BACL|nr:ImmA/IrrE family metallo-endopeptidase [Paenibacillus whitsoniae]RTE09311.1 ImmA/IrrE family metallo-endopeptidase [Paenibacillus whitsoniae]